MTGVTLVPLPGTPKLIEGWVKPYNPEISRGFTACCDAAFFAFIATALESTGLQGFKKKMEVGGSRGKRRADRSSMCQVVTWS
jgi:hypothetical protein